MKPMDLILRTEICRVPKEKDQRQMHEYHWSEWALADEACERSVFKGYIYLVDRCSGEEILVKEFD